MSRMSRMNRMNGVASFFKGVYVPVRGAELVLKSPRLFRLMLIPFFVGILVILLGVSFGISFLWGFLPPAAMQLVSRVGVEPNSTAASVLYWTSLLLAWPTVLFALLYSLVLLAKLIAAPFFTLLAERVLKDRNSLHQERVRFWSWLKTSLRMFAISIVKLGVFGAMSLLFFIVSLLPGLGLLAGYAFTLLLAFDIVDVTFEVWGWPMSRRTSFLRQNFAFFSGLGLVLALAFLVPVLNFCVLPLAIAGAADMVQSLNETQREV